MYKPFYNLIKPPFSKGMPSSDLFMSEGMEEILSRLIYVVNNKMFATVSGECGTGKSTLLRKLKSSLDDKIYDLVYIADSKLTPRNFYNAVLNQFGVEGAFYRGDSKRLLHREIAAMTETRNRIICIIVDEAHLLDKEMLEEIRFLLNSKMDSESPVSLLLVGQLDLEFMLDKRTSLAISQRIDFRCRLCQMTLEETIAYIRHQMNYAGASKEIFLKPAAKEIFEFSGGIARIVNKICNKCLMYGAINKKKTIDAKIAGEIIEHES